MQCSHTQRTLCRTYTIFIFITWVRTTRINYIINKITRNFLFRSVRTQRERAQSSLGMPENGRNCVCLCVFKWTEKKKKCIHLAWHKRKRKTRQQQQQITKIECRVSFITFASFYSIWGRLVNHSAIRNSHILARSTVLFFVDVVVVASRSNSSASKWGSKSESYTLFFSFSYKRLTH